jgi:hypothetical protein
MAAPPPSRAPAGAARKRACGEVAVAEQQVGRQPGALHPDDRVAQQREGLRHAAEAARPAKARVAVVAVVAVRRRAAEVQVRRQAGRRERRREEGRVARAAGGRAGGAGGARVVAARAARARPGLLRRALLLRARAARGVARDRLLQFLPHARLLDEEGAAGV